MVQGGRERAQAFSAEVFQAAFVPEVGIQGRTEEPFEEA